MRVVLLCDDDVMCLCNFDIVKSSISSNHSLTHSLTHPLALSLEFQAVCSSL